MRFRVLSRKVAGVATAALVAGVALTTIGAESAVADSVTATQAMRIVQQYQGVWNSPPTHLANGETQDGPMLGNGDVGVVVGGRIDSQTFYIGKNDFFSLNSHTTKPLGRVVLAVPGLAGSSYQVVQDIARAEVRGTYGLGGSTLNTTSWMSATSSVLVTSLTLSGSTAQNASITLQNGLGGTPAVSASGGVLSANVSADASGPFARVSSRVIGGTSSITGNRIDLTLQPGVTYTVVAGVVSSIDSASYQSAAVSLVSALTQTGVNTLSTSHLNWWQTYWSQSYVEIPDKAVEKAWYGSLYLLGSATRSGEYATGLWGPWATGNMNWDGTYFANYNYESAYYSGLSTNRIAQIDSYDQPVLDWMAPGQTMAAQNEFGEVYQGVLYPVSLSPKGTTSHNFTQLQKSHTANLASNMIMRFSYTRDTTYAAKVYPYLKQVALFWQNYLKLENGVYNNYNDSAQENQAYPQTNNILSLGLVHLLMQGLVDMSTALNQDAALRATWQDIDTRLAPFPTMTRNGQTVFRQTSAGSDWVNDQNAIAIQAVYPGGQIGLKSSPTLLQTARNTIDQLTAADQEPRWHGYNAPALLYPAAARVGYDPATIMSNLHDEAVGNMYNNLHIHHGGGGVENLNVVTSGLNEMLLQSFQNEVKVFANWPANTNGKFGDLLAYGNFLVTSSKVNNSVQYIRAVSQSGRDFTFTNPWPGQSVQVYRNGGDAGTVSGSTITLPTATNEILTLGPAGTSLSTIQQQLAQPLPAGTAPTSFSSGLESGQPSPAWSDSVDTLGGGAGNVTGICCGLTAPQASPRTGETAHAGTSSLMYSGNAQGGSAYAYMRVFDLSGNPLPIGTSKTLSYWIYPQSNATTTHVPTGSTNSTCVSVDMIFTDGSTLRDSGAVDQTGDPAHPAQQCGHLTLDTWNQVTVNLATNNSNKQINRILIGYDKPGSTGGYRGYIDDITITGGSSTNLALGRPATQSSTFSTANASRAVDGNTNGDWSSDTVTHTNSDLNAWWQVDLGAASPVSSIAVWNRTDCCGDRLGDYWVFVSSTPFNTALTPALQAGQPGVVWSNHQTSQASSPTTIPANTNGRYVMVQLSGTNYLSLAELQVFS